jgi:hypothetical protein
VGLTTLLCKKKIVVKPPRNSAGFCGGGQGLSWTVEPRKEEDQIKDEMGGTGSTHGRNKAMWKPKRSWKDSIRIDLWETEWEGVNWIHLAQDRDQWWAVVNTVMKFPVS